MFVDSSRIKILEVLSEGKEDKHRIKQGARGFVTPHLDINNNALREIQVIASESNGNIREPFAVFNGGKREQACENVYEFGKHILICDIMEVMFTSFDAKDKRCERKTIINVLPTTNQSKIFDKESLTGDRFAKTDILRDILVSKSNLTAFIKYMDKFYINHLSRNGQKTSSDVLKDSNKPAICIAVPDYANAVVKDITQESNEYTAWCRSVLNNRLLPVYLFANHYSNIMPVNDLEDVLREHLLDNALIPKLSTVDKIFDGNKKRVVHMLREILLSTLNAYDHKSRLGESYVRHAFNNMSNKPSTAEVATAIGQMAWKLFKKPMYDIIVNEGKKRNRTAIRKIEDIMIDQSELLYKSTLID